MPIGIKALGTCPLRAEREALGEIDIPTSFGGIIFRPDDWLYADADGVIIAPHKLA